MPCETGAWRKRAGLSTPAVASGATASVQPPSDGSAAQPAAVRSSIGPSSTDPFGSYLNEIGT